MVIVQNVKKIPQSGNPEATTMQRDMTQMPTRGSDDILSHMFDFVLFYRQKKLRE